MNNRLQDKLYETAKGLEPAAWPISTEKALSSLNGWRKRLGETMAERPAEFLVGAVAAGFLFGWWMKHK